MTKEELESDLEDLFPDGFFIKKDSAGRVVIHTNLVEDEDGDLVFSSTDDEDEEEPDVDDLEDVEDPE